LRCQLERQRSERRRRQLNIEIAAGEAAEWTKKKKKKKVNSSVPDIVCIYPEGNTVEREACLA
jgi:Lhr-like helicase